MLTLIITEDKSIHVKKHYLQIIAMYLLNYVQGKYISNRYTHWYVIPSSCCGRTVSMYCTENIRFRNIQDSGKTENGGRSKLCYPYCCSCPGHCRCCFVENLYWVHRQRIHYFPRVSPYRTSSLLER